MSRPAELKNISIRTSLQSGDIGRITWLHGTLYKNEYNYGIAFESYVAAGFAEFYQQYDPARDRVWIAEHDGTIVGFLLLMHRDNNAAQLRYFLVTENYRGIGLGNKLMRLFMDFARSCGYTSSYLWTTSELTAAATLYKRFGFELTEEKRSESFDKDVVEQRYDCRTL
jgi:peptidyl-dipeptidase Dcp